LTLLAVPLLFSAFLLVPVPIPSEKCCGPLSHGC